jgi:hypothetical protein
MRSSVIGLLGVYFTFALLGGCANNNQDQSQTYEGNAEWALTSQNPTRQSLIAFVRKYPQSSHCHDAMLSLKSFGTRLDQLTISDAFPDSADANDFAETTTDVKIQNEYRDGKVIGVVLTGTYEFSVDGRKLTWNPGATHHISPDLNLNSGYIFLSTDGADLLTFKVVQMGPQKRGYSYLSGSGIVVNPTDNVFLFGPPTNTQ